MQNSSINIKDFEIIKILGSGSFGQVQLAKRKNDERLFAIKSVHLSKLAIKQKNNALNQVRLLASIHIPYVIGYQCAFFNNDTQCLCIVMQYADGGDLHNKITQLSDKGIDGFDENYIWKVAYEMLQALKLLHSHKIVHRDIKSANIFFANGIAKLGDLNVSKVVEQGWCQTQTGTPYYTSPQIWKGQKYTEKCDIWSLGCVIYQMCALSPPFRAKQYPSLFKKVTQGQYEQISDQYSPQLANFIRTCLTLNETYRPSAQQLLQTNAILIGIELSIDKTDKKQSDSICLIDPIKCPRVLKFLNNRLPKNKSNQNIINKKKGVLFIGKKWQNQQETPDLISYRKIRSQKIIAEVQDTNNNQSKTKKIIKLPAFEKKTLNQPLIFSNKKIKQSKRNLSKTIQQIGKENKNDLL